MSHLIAEAVEWLNATDTAPITRRMAEDLFPHWPHYPNLTDAERRLALDHFDAPEVPHAGAESGTLQRLADSPACPACKGDGKVWWQGTGNGDFFRADCDRCSGTVPRETSHEAPADSGEVPDNGNLFTLGDLVEVFRLGREIGRRLALEHACGGKVAQILRGAEQSTRRAFARGYVVGIFRLGREIGQREAASPETDCAPDSEVPQELIEALIRIDKRLRDGARPRKAKRSKDDREHTYTFERVDDQWLWVCKCGREFLGATHAELLAHLRGEGAASEAVPADRTSPAGLDALEPDA